jgi:hypothetical protein
VELSLIFAISLLSLASALILNQKVLKRAAGTRRMPYIFNTPITEAREFKRRLSSLAPKVKRGALTLAASLAGVAASATAAVAQTREAGGHTPGGEANLKLPQLSSQQFLGTDGHTLLLVGLGVCVLG